MCEYITVISFSNADIQMFLSSMLPAYVYASEPLTTSICCYMRADYWRDKRSGVLHASIFHLTIINKNFSTYSVHFYFVVSRQIYSIIEIYMTLASVTI